MSRRCESGARLENTRRKPPVEIPARAIASFSNHAVRAIAGQRVHPVWKSSVWKEVGFSPTAFQVFTPLFSFDDRINIISS